MKSVFSCLRMFSLVVLPLLVIFSCNKAEKEDEIILDKTSLTLSVGEEYQLTATGLPSGTTIQWVSSDPNVVSVVSGLVTALKEGEATIIAYANNLSASCVVTVEGSESKKLISEIKYLHSDEQLTYSLNYDKKDRLTLFEGISGNGGKMKAIFDWSSSPSPLLIYEQISEGDIERSEYALVCNQYGQIVSGNEGSLNEFVYSYDNQGKIKKLTTTFEKSTETVTYSYNAGNLSTYDFSMQSGSYSYKKTYNYEYGKKVAAVDISFVIFSPDFLLDLITAIPNKFPGNLNLPEKVSTGKTEDEAEFSYEFDAAGCVTWATQTYLHASDAYYNFAYVDGGTQNYVYETPFVNVGMGGTTWKHSTSDGDQFIVFLDGTKCYLVEPDGPYTVAMSLCNYVQSGTSIVITYSSGSSQKRNCVLNGSTINCDGDIYVKTSNFIF